MIGSVIVLTVISGGLIKIIYNQYLEYKAEQNN
jgi:hypothetical protein